MNQFFINPIRLEFNFNPYKHKGYLQTQWTDNRINLKGNTQCLICDDYDEGLKLLKSEIMSYGCFINHDVDEEDFSLVYESEVIKDNRVWASGHVTSSKKLSEI